MPLCKDFEEKLIKHIWRTRKIARRSTFGTAPPSTANTTNAPSISGSQAELYPPTTNHSELDEKGDGDGNLSEDASVQTKPPSTPPTRKWWSWRLQPTTRQPSHSTGDMEKGAGRKKPRKLILLGPLYAGCGAALAMCTFIFFDYSTKSNF